MPHFTVKNTTQVLSAVALAACNIEALTQSFIDQHVRGIGQVYFAGHDHSRQWLNESARLGGTEMIVSGAGGSTTSLRDRGNQSFFADATLPGFLYVVVDGDTMTGEFHDKTGALNFSRTIHR